METRVESACFQQLQLCSDEPLFKLCVQFHLAPLHAGKKINLTKYAVGGAAGVIVLGAMAGG
jgi:hypothetical protein